MSRNFVIDEVTGDPVCPDCQASMRRWSDAARERGFRRGVTRVYRPEHGQCGCGGNLDQYGDRCEQHEAHGPVNAVAGTDPALAAALAEAQRGTPVGRCHTCGLPLVRGACEECV